MPVFICYLFLFILGNLFTSAQTIEVLPPLEDRWALIIGITEYEDKQLNLSFADKDAEAINNLLINSCRFPKDHIKVLTNTKATYENIRRAIEGFLSKNADKNHKIVIFFSGHGTQEIDDNNDEDDGYDEFLVPYDFDDTDISSAIKDDVFSYWINNLRSENILIIFDSCYSGGAAKAKGFNHVKTRGSISVDGFRKDIFKEIPKSGVALLAACEDRQYSFEAPAFNMGLFTYYLIDSINKNYDTDNNQSLSIQEIFEPVKKNVIAYSNKTFKEEQTPILISSLSSPFELVYLPQDKMMAPESNEQESMNIYYQAYGITDKMRRIKLLEEAIKLDPKNFFAYKRLAETYIGLDNAEKAIHCYELALMLDFPGKDSIYLGLSEAYEHLGNFTVAFQYAEQALNNREDVRNVNRLARLYFLTNDYNNAIKYYSKSIDLNVRDYEAPFELARIFIQQEQYDQAFIVLNNAININPDREEFYYLKGLLMYYIKSDYEEARTLFKKFSETDKIFSITIRLYKIDSSDLPNIILDSINKDGFFAEFYMCAISYFEKIKDTQKAREYLDRLIKYYPFFKDTKKLKELKSQIR